MKSLKYLALVFSLLVLTVGIKAQTPTVLATANNQNFTSADLDPATREMYETLDKRVADERTEQLASQIAQILFADEAAAKKIEVSKLLEAEIQKRIPAPSEAQIKAVYDANAQQIGGRPLADVKPQIVAYLQREAQSKALFDYVGELKAKYKVVMGKDVNAKSLLASDVLATVNGKTITVQGFDAAAGQSLYELKAETYERTAGYLEEVLYSTVVTLEAKSLNIESQDLIAREISDKLRDYSDAEREKLQTALENKLFQKYKAKILIKEPAPFVQNVSVDDDPSRGSATAPVTVVMFTDFQCPACRATHPVLQQVISEYGDKIRFVVRDYPLEMHKNSFIAAQAANAANAQGKFFEYTEILYNNQDSLDVASLKKFAGQLGLNQKQFDTDLDSGKFAAEVKKDIADGDKYGVSATPTIFVNGVKVRLLSITGLRRAIEGAMTK